MRYLLDTDTCVFALRGVETVRNHFSAVDPGAVAVSVVTLAELRYGASCSPRPEANHRVVDDFISGILILGVDTEIARLFGEFKAKLRGRGTLIDDFDLLIAAAAERYGLTLVTHNLEHFHRIDGLQVEDWTSP